MSRNRPGIAPFVSWFCHCGRGIVAAMERDDTDRTDRRGDAVIEVLLTPGKGSFVDALLALADEAADDEADVARRALHDGFQAALARRMRAAIGQEGGVRDAA